ncbi:MAG: CNNM domain-containing protein [Spirochaetales bacterium]
MSPKDDIENQIIEESENKKNRGHFFREVIRNKKIDWTWPLKIFLTTFTLAIVFSIGSEAILTGAGLAISLVLVFVLLAISVVFDMIGVSVAAASLEPFVAMASKKVSGSKEAINLLKNAEKVSSFASDVVGDICGILSGAVGAAIVAQIYISTGDFKSVLIAALVSSIIAALTVFGKAVGKNFAIHYPEKIVLKVSKFLSIFISKDKR